MPVSNVSAALYCEGSLVTFGDWGGVSLNYLLQQAGVDPAVASIDFLAQDGYNVSIPLQIAMQSNVIIAYAENGSSLNEELRLVLPGENGGMWISLITSITMDRAKIDINQYLASTKGLPPNNPVGQSATSPANITQPAQSTSPQQASNTKNLGFPDAVVYGIALGATIALVAASYLALSRKRRKTELAPIFKG